MTVIRFEGDELEAHPDDNVAVALYRAGVRTLSRSIKYHRPRGIFCLAGHCGACLMRIDGQPNVKACRTPCRDGLVVERQNAFPSADLDALAAADFFFPRGMDHHTLMTGNRALNVVMQKVVRQIGGLGRLPDQPVATLPAPRRRHVEVVVVGAGPAGLAAATALGRAGRQVLLVDEQDRPGGSYLADPRFGLAAADRAVQCARAAGAEILRDAAVLAWYPEDAPATGAPPGLLAVHVHGQGLLRLTAERYLYATGAYDQNALFADNDRPGVLAARAVGRLLVQHGIVAGRRPVVLGAGPYARALAEALQGAGAEVIRVDGVATRILAARGRSWVNGIEVLDPGGAKPRRISCDMVVVAALPAPASELPRQHGAGVTLRPEAGGFACIVGGTGEAARGVWACGDVTGFVGPAAAAWQGTAVGEAVARTFVDQP